MKSQLKVVRKKILIPALPKGAEIILTRPPVSTVVPTVIHYNGFKCLENGKEIIEKHKHLHGEEPRLN